MAGAVLAERIAAHLRRAILRGALPPGAPIKERDHAAELGVSRTPMREAIRQLAKEGLVDLRPARSPIVTRLSPREVADQVAVLLALETLAAELACAHASEDDLRDLHAIHDRIGALYDQADPLDLFEIDMAFHSAIARASQNRALAETHHGYLARLWRVRFLSARQARNRARVVAQHEAILAALTARDTAAARQAVAAHLGNLAENILPVLEAEAAGPIETRS